MVTPRWVRGLRLSATWTDAKRTNAISSLTAQTLVNEEADFPTRITREAAMVREAVLLETLAENQVSVPEVGTFVAKQPPYVILTSNNTRELENR